MIRGNDQVDINQTIRQLFNEFNTEKKSKLHHQVKNEVDRRVRILSKCSSVCSSLQLQSSFKSGWNMSGTQDLRRLRPTFMLYRKETSIKMKDDKVFLGGKQREQLRPTFVEDCLQFFLIPSLACIFCTPFLGLVSFLVQF